MNIKTFIAAAVISLTAACNQAEEAPVEAPAVDAGADGQQNEEDNGTNPRTVSEENPAQ